MEDLFQADINNRGLVLDPRTKLFAMLTIVIFVVGGAGNIPNIVLNIYAALPLVLLALSKRFAIALKYGVVFLLACVLNKIISLHNPGAISVLLVMCCVIIIKIIPGLIMGAYIFSSTTVSEFIAALQRMHIGNEFSVPLSVMFRFFPTVLEEFKSINDAMVMRDIRLGKQDIAKLIEYRLVPLMVCSVNIGNEIAEASLTRGLSVDTKRTNICEIGFKLQDIVTFIVFIIPYVYAVILKTGIFL